MAIRTIGDAGRTKAAVSRPAGLVPVRTIDPAPTPRTDDSSEHAANNEHDGDEQNSDVPIGDAEFAAPASLGGSDSTGTSSGGKRGRGRPPGSGGKRRTSPRDTSKTTDSIAAMLFTVHTVAAGFTGMKFLNISKDGSKELAEAITTVTELYEVEIVNEKAMAWLNLAGCMARVYVFNQINTPASPGPVRVPQQTAPVSMPDFMRGKPN